MRNRRITKLEMLALICVIGMSTAVGPLDAAPDSPQATVEHFGGSYANWPVSWIPLSTLNDPSDMTSNEQVDFVGDSTNPAVYWYSSADYLFFRMRVDYDSVVTTISPFHDSVFVFIDIVGSGTIGYPDFGIAWDSQSNDVTKHGEEMMQAPGSPGSTWETYQMVDVDGVSNNKVLSPCPTCDIGYNNGDGYIRTVDSQSTTSFGSTTFIDFAVKWSYLELNTALRRSGQTWRSQVGTRFSSTDHSNISTDVGGGCTPTSAVTACWSGTMNPSDPLAIDLGAFTASTTSAGVVLAWETVSEVDTAGFNIFRALGTAGPWVKLNAGLIPAAAPGSSDGYAYQWLDSTAKPATSYVYRLESVALDGTVKTQEVVNTIHRPGQRLWLPMPGR